MPIIGDRKVGKEEGSSPPSFTKEELGFIATKLNAGMYQGTEFGLYYGVMSKIKALLEKK